MMQQTHRLVCWKDYPTANTVQHVARHSRTCNELSKGTQLHSAAAYRVVACTSVVTWRGVSKLFEYLDKPEIVPLLSRSKLLRADRCLAFNLLLLSAFRPSPCWSVVFFQKKGKILPGRVAKKFGCRHTHTQQLRADARTERNARTDVRASE